MKSWRKIPGKISKYGAAVLSVATAVLVTHALWQIRLPLAPHGTNALRAERCVQSIEEFQTSSLAATANAPRIVLKNVLIETPQA